MALVDEITVYVYSLPTEDWKVLHVDKPNDANGGQFYVLQINEVAEKMLYARFGKISWGCRSVNLRLKRKKKNETQQWEPDLNKMMECPDLWNMTIESDIEIDFSDEAGEIDTTVVEPASNKSHLNGS